MFKDFLSRRQKEEEVKHEGRLPPGQALTQKFPVLHYGPVPLYNNLDNWTFMVFGLVEEERTWTWAEFNKLPRRQVRMDIHCVTRWSKFDTEWEGVHFRDLIDGGLIRLKPEAKFCVQHCEYGFTVNLPVDVMLADNFLMATHYDGKPLEPDHGYPLRGVIGAIPGKRQDSDRYLWKGGKWLRGLEFVAEDEPGFWEQAGYSMSAGIWNEERFARRGW
jgi:DMSO/TMAO reductase YedYZ molybdopterin-dependent catalytic subunit